MKNLSYEQLIDFSKRNYLKNRTTVTRDISSIFKDIEQTLDLPLKYNKYPSGSEYGTWIIPPSWNVKEAWLKNSKGELIASYEDQPLFLCPYSKSTHEKISKSDLLPHVFSEERQPDAFGYNRRYAYDKNLQLKDWGISLPKNIIDQLPEDVYEIYISTEVFDSEMLVGEVYLEGDRKEELVFVAYYCHPGQMNDSFSGLIMFMKVMHTLAQRKSRRFSYKFIFMPETIGSAAYISDDPRRLQTMIGTIFSEMVGWGEEWYVKASRSGTSYVDTLAKNCINNFQGVKSSDFMTIYRNDELMFNSVQANVPSLSVQKYPYEEYHTSEDTVKRVNIEDLEQAHDMICYMVDILEKDNVYSFIHDVPFWMTRYDLFSDDVYEPDEFWYKFELVYLYMDGTLSVAELAEKIGVKFEKAKVFIDKMAEHGLVKKNKSEFDKIVKRIER